jgi:hypothetical protein
MRSEWTLGRDRPHFHPRSVIEARHALCDRRRLLEAVRGHQQVAADCWRATVTIGGQRQL